MLGKIAAAVAASRLAIDDNARSMINSVGEWPAVRVIGLEPPRAVANLPPGMVNNRPSVSSTSR
ncbi:hypothetical protein ACFQZ4_46420 [Catellatospora coxensis]